MKLPYLWLNVAQLFKGKTIMKYLLLTILLSGCALKLVDETDKTLYLPVAHDLTRKCTAFCHEQDKKEWRGTRINDKGKVECLCLKPKVVEPEKDS